MKKIIAVALLVIIAGMALGSIGAPASSSRTHGTYVQMAQNEAQQAGIDPTLFVRQIKQESGFNPKAVSSAGAIGIAQFMPETARGLGINPYDPAESLHGAALLMSRYIQHYGSEVLALAAYNAGTATLNRCLRTASWYRCLPGETQRYISIILRR